MTAAAYLDLKQQLARLPERKRREMSAFLIRLGQNSTAWKRHTAKRLNEMEAGQKVSVADLRRQLGHD